MKLPLTQLFLLAQRHCARPDRMSPCHAGAVALQRVWQMLSGLVLLVTVLMAFPAQAQSVADGAALYVSKGCQGCHGTDLAATTENHRLASNNPQRIDDAINNNLSMNGNAGMIAFKASANYQRDLMSLALYIGQVKAPLFKVSNGDALLAMRVRSGASGSKNIYTALQDDGTGGAARDAASGWTATGNGAASASHTGAGASMNYQVSYTAPGGTAGPQSFTASAVNPAGSDARTIAVTVIGIDQPAAPLVGVKGFQYTTGSPLSTVTCNGCTASNFGGTSLPTGLTVTADGKIIGMASERGVFPLPSVSGFTTGSTLPSNGTVSRTVQITLVGIDSGNPPNYEQGVAISTPYQVTTTGTIVAGPNAYSLSPLPAGMTFDTALGRLAGSPADFGSSVVTITAATTAGVTSEQVTITVNAANAPTNISSNLPVSTDSTAGTVGTSIDAAAYSISATSGAQVTYSSTELAAIGLTVNPSTGAITGTPNTSGDIPVVLRASNIGGEGTPLNRTIRIAPNTAPVVDSAIPPDGNVGVDYAAAAFSVTATNPIITGFAVASGSAMPPGLMLNASTGRITGPPGASGIFKTRFTATNSFGTSAPVELTFNIISDQKPSITSPTSASFPAGVAITPIQVVATNPVITAYRDKGTLPAGLTLDANGVISGIPTTPGMYTVKLSADNAAPGAAFGADLDVPFTIGVPAPTACAMSVPLNTATTLDLSACLFAGFVPTGVSIVANPAHGKVVVSGTRVTYTPVNNYFGADSFTFVGSGVGGNSPQGTVSVTVTGRPDPVQDATVTGLLTAQVESAQRFSRAQISNFQRRMESLHRGPGAAPAPGAAGLRLQGRIDTPANMGFAGYAQAGRDTTVSPQTPGGITALAANHSPTVARESEVLMALAAGAGVQSMPLAEGVISLVKNRSVNLSGIATGLGLNNTPATESGGTSYWIEGVATFGTRDASGGFGSSEFSSDGISVGVDKRYSDQFAIGVGLGYARDKTLIGTDGSLNRGKAYSLAVYGSYQPTPATFVDAMLGIGSLDFNTSRYVAPINDFAYGERSGTQVFGSLTGGYEFREGNLLLSPYGRIDFSTDRLDSSAETGAGVYALRYMRQTATSIQGALGMRAESIHATDFGYAVPRARIEYRHEFKRSGDAYIQYADQVGGPLYRMPSAGGPRDSMVLGLGSDLIFRDGLSLSLEYQLSHSFSNASTHALRLRLSKDFGVRGLPRLLSEDPELVHDEPINVQVEAGAIYDDNVTRAKAGADRLGDHLYSINIGKAIRQPLSENSRLLWIGTLGGEKFRRYNGLSRVSLGGEVEYQYRASSEFDEPTFGVFARLTGDAFESELRDGLSLSTGVSVRQSLTDRINVFAALSHNRRNASSEVFSTRDNAIRGNIDYALSDKEILYMGAEYRRGDIVSTGRPSLENATVADVFAQDDAYAGGQMFSYRFRGSTTLLTLGYNLALGPRDSIDLSWRHIRSTPGLRPAFLTSPRSYRANQLSLVYLMRF